VLAFEGWVCGVSFAPNLVAASALETNASAANAARRVGRDLIIGVLLSVVSIARWIQLPPGRTARLGVPGRVGAALRCGRFHPLVLEVAL
jgi:hypothetical protein